MFEEIVAAFGLKKQDVRAYSPLALAYVGDGVYELMIRTVLIEQANRQTGRLHRMAVRYVSAAAQAKIAQALEERFTEEERAVYRRGRNAKPHTMAKNADPGDYRKATGFEAVLGYLYLCGRTGRALELVKTGVLLAGLGW